MTSTGMARRVRASVTKLQENRARSHVGVFVGNILLGGIFHAAVLVIEALGCGWCSACRRSSIWPAAAVIALGAFFGITFVTLALKAGMPPWTLLPAVSLSPAL